MKSGHYIDSRRSQRRVLVHKGPYMVECVQLLSRSKFLFNFWEIFCSTSIGSNIANMHTRDLKSILFNPLGPP